MQIHKRPPASILFIFGGSGDLNYRKLTPALYNLFLDDWMPEQFAIAGLGRSPYSNEDYHKYLLEGISKFSRKSHQSRGPLDKHHSGWRFEIVDDVLQLIGTESFSINDCNSGYHFIVVEFF